MTGWIDLLQWPAMALTVAAAYLVGSTRAGRRNVGFWLFLASNVLWVAWGLPAAAYGVVVLQVCLAALNLRGMHKTRQQAAASPPARPAHDRAV